MDQWAAERLQIFSLTRTTWTIVSGTSTYTVGTGGTVNVVRPVFIDHVNFQDTSMTIVTEYPMNPLTDDAYAGVVLKTLTSPYPQAWWYNPTFGASALGTLFLWPTPTSSTLQGVMYAQTAVTQFAGLTDTVSLPPGYARMLVSNLAIDLLPSYERDAHPALVQKASDSKAAVKRANKKLMDLRFEAASLINMHPIWDIHTGP